MPPPTTVFLDMDGVLVDPDKLPREYERLVGHVLVPELGSTVEDWGRANAASFPRWCRFVQSLPPEEHPLDRYDRESVLSVRGMCEVLGIPAPTDEVCKRLGRELNAYVREHHDAFFPGIAESVATIAATHRVHFATGNPSWCVEIAVRRLGLDEHVGLPCGPDLLGVLKNSPRFYPLLFEKAQVAPAEAVVVDDTPAQLALAAEAGARTVLVGRDAAVGTGVDVVVPSVNALPRALARLAKRP